MRTVLTAPPTLAGPCHTAASSAQKSCLTPSKLLTAPQAAVTQAVLPPVMPVVPTPPEVAEPPPLREAALGWAAPMAGRAKKVWGLRLTPRQLELREWAGSTQWVCCWAWRCSDAVCTPVSAPSELPGVQPKDPGVHRAHPSEQETRRREVRSWDGSSHDLGSGEGSVGHPGWLGALPACLPAVG